MTRINEPTALLRGHLGTDPSLRPGEDGRPDYLRFRLAVVRTRRDPATGTWADEPTDWYTVKAWRALAQNAGHSLRKGDPVVVFGRLVNEEWQDAEQRTVVSPTVHAELIAHDLRRGTTHFLRTPPATATGAVPGLAGPVDGVVSSEAGPVEAGSIDGGSVEAGLLDESVPVDVSGLVELDELNDPAEGLVAAAR